MLTAPRWFKRATISFISIFVTIVVVLAILNLIPQEVMLDHVIENASPVDTPQFQHEASNLPGPYVLDGNHIQDLENGAQIYPAMLAAIRGAKHSVDFETYIYFSGKIGKKFEQALSERARAGITVHALVDAIGARKMDTPTVRTLRASGVHFEFYHPLRWNTLDRFNNRDHRKLLIVDGRIGFTGGANIADAWMGDAQQPDHWRDMQFQVEGPVVAQMEAVFESDWITTTGHVLLGTSSYPALPHVGNIHAQMFASSPFTSSENLQMMFLQAIAGARSSIDLDAAYFVPDELVQKALLKALNRGVKIRIIVPGPHDPDQFVTDASQTEWEEMLGAGARIYRFQPSRFHCKMMIVDRYLTMVGSANFDNRSLKINNEANINVYDATFGQHMTDVFNGDVARSREVTLAEWRNRPWTRKFKDWLWSLTSSQL